MATDLMSARHDVEPLGNGYLIRGSTFVSAATYAIQYGSALQYNAANYSVQGGTEDTAFSGISQDEVLTTADDTTISIPVVLQGEYEKLPVAGTPIVGAKIYLENDTSTNGTDKWWLNLTTDNTNAYCVGVITGFDNVAGYYTVLISVSLAAFV